jgi:hypothetical protein
MHTYSFGGICMPNNPESDRAFGVMRDLEVLR